jgi:hypothetical protein
VCVRERERDPEILTVRQSRPMVGYFVTEKKCKHTIRMSLKIFVYAVYDNRTKVHGQ